jgi:flagellar biosynthesis/type III secretory pathway chaperone
LGFADGENPPYPWQKRREVPQHFASSNSVEEDQRESEALSNLMQELAGILEVEIDQYCDLLRLLRDQREKIIAADVRSVEEIIKRQETAVLKIKTLEEARKCLVLKLAQYFGSPSEEFTLIELVDLVDKPYNQWFTAYQKEIVSLIGELENLRESNAYLIQQGLHYVNGVLRIFASVQSTDLAYSRNGKLEREKKKGKYVSGWG